MVIRVNDGIGYYFQAKKGLRQGYPLSLVLFNIIADMLAILIARAKEGGQVVVSILQYAYDTILFMEHDLDKAINMKVICASLSNYLVLRLIST
jgi:hypothetical protein